MITRPSIVLLLVAAAALTASVGYAQSSGDIRGTLFDSAGAVMPGCPSSSRTRTRIRYGALPPLMREFMPCPIWCLARTR